MKKNNSFHCRRCGYCCTLRVKLSLIDILRLRFGNFKLKNYATKNPRGDLVIKMVNENNDCYFLKRKNNKTYCIAYKYRPNNCRQYPFIQQDVKCKGLSNP